MRAYLPLSAALLSLAASLAQAGSPFPIAPGRVAEVEGSLLLLPAGWDDWREAELNSALAPGDWLRSSHDGTASLELAPSLVARLAPRTELRLDRQDGVLVLELLEGSLVVCSGDGGEEVSVVTPHGAAWLEPGGFYRVDASPRRTTVFVSSGLVELERGDRVRSVRPGRLGELGSGSGGPRVRSATGRPWDEFQRDSREACNRLLGRRGELSRLVGAGQLDGHGQWVDIRGQRYWRPYDVGDNWRPFGDGCFRWHPSWGWYFVPRASWGWVTHHHGWWSWVQGWGWVWLPDHAWHPHRVVFRVVDDDVYWRPRDRGRDRDRDRDDDVARQPDHAWSRAPVVDFARHPVVRTRPSVGRGELPRLPTRAPGFVPPPGRLDRPPLPPRASEPTPEARRPFVARMPARRPGAPSPVPTPDPATIRRPGDANLPAVPSRPRLPASEADSEPAVRTPERPPLPPPRLRPRPWTRPEREPSDEPPRAPAPVPRPALEPPATPVRVVVPRPVIRQPVRRPEPPKPPRVEEPRQETPKPVIRQPVRRPEAPKPVQVEKPRPVVRPPVRRSRPPAPAPPPKKEKSEEKDDGTPTRR